MPAQDSSFGWNVGRKIIYAIDWNSQQLEAAGTLTGQGAGTPVWAASGVAASELTGIAIGADGDELYHMFPVPWNMDPQKDVWLRVVFSHDSTDADTPIWQAWGKWVAKQAALTDAKSSGDATVDWAAHTCSTTTGSLERTVWARLGLGSKWTSSDIALILALECGTMSGSAGELIFHWLEMAYTIAAMDENRGARDTTHFDPGTPQDSLR